MDLIDRARSFVSRILEGEPSTHDMSHIERVESTCMKIQANEGGDLQVLRLSALLHDVGIVQEHRQGGDHAVYSAHIARQFLEDNGAEAKLVDHVTSCILSHRFSRGIQAQTLEAMILQDADRIDALGAVGIFRSLVSMGALRTLKQTTGTVKETSMNAYTEDPFHGFYDYMERKPFKIAQRLNTATAKEIAEHRFKIMCLYMEKLREETS